MKYICTFTLLILCSTAWSQDNFSYTKHDGTIVTLNTFEGVNTLFSFDEDLFPELTDEMIQNSILPAFDKAMENYRYFGADIYPQQDWVTHSSFGYNHKGSVALVDSTCGAGCGAGSKAEVLNSIIKSDQTRTNYQTDPSIPTFWWIALYELGRGSANFSAYKNLSFNPDNHHIVGASFPHLIANITLNDLGYTPDEVFNEVKNSIYQFRNRYDIALSQGYKFSDWFTDENGNSLENGPIESTDVLAIALYEFYLQYGKEALKTFFEMIKLDDTSVSTSDEYACRISNNMDQAVLHLDLGGTASSFLQSDLGFPECGSALVNEYNSHCLDLPSPFTSGTKIINWACHYSSNQQWNLLKVFSGEPESLGEQIVNEVPALKIINQDGYCLELESQTVGSEVYLQNCDSRSINQLFSLTAEKELRTTSNQCLDANGSRALLWACHGGTNQMWHIE